MSEPTYKNEYLLSLFRYIENNISADLNTTLLSNIGYVSRDKLYRDFYNISGHSVKAYIRKRRLSNALALIKTSDMGLADITFQCGYSSQQALCREVRQKLGLTPTEYKSGNVYYFFPPFNGEPVQSVNVFNQTIPTTIRISFYHTKLTKIENKAISTFMRVFPDYSGRIFGRNGKQEGSKFRYELYLTDTTKNYDILKSYGFGTAKEISCFTTTFATSTVNNIENKINIAWDYLYSQWLHNSMFEYTDKPYFEEYILKNKKPVKLKLYLPIREQSKETKITLINNPKLRFITAKAKGYNAEEIASQIVIDYLTEYYPFIINTSKELYLKKETNAYVCGVKINTKLPLVIDKNIVNFVTKSNNYLVLESGIMGDYDRYADMLLLFAHDNGIDAIDDEMFAVYHMNESFDNPKIKMYCPIRIRTK